MLEVFNNLFMNIAEQMGATLAEHRLFREHQGTARFLLRAVRRHRQPGRQRAACAGASRLHERQRPHGGSAEQCRATSKPGDAFMLNAPFNGGTHLPDVTVITPVFDEAGHDHPVLGRLARAPRRYRRQDAGLGPAGFTHIDEEGVVIDNFRSSNAAPSAKPPRARCSPPAPTPAATSIRTWPISRPRSPPTRPASARCAKMIAISASTCRAGLHAPRAGQRRGERAPRHRHAEATGTSTYPLDDGSGHRGRHHGRPRKAEATIDFTGTSRSKGNYNAPKAVCDGGRALCLPHAGRRDIPLNEGCLKPSIIRPNGSMINPDYPAAVIAGNTEVSQAITDCLYGALGVIAGRRGR
jgi:5-oxoprolinase (ATP-hydrolysing)